MAAQAKVYQLFSGKLFALCLKYSKNYEDAEDTLQDSFLTIFEKINQYKNKGSFEGWMKRVTINTALQKYREKSHLRIIKEEDIESGEITTSVDNEDMSLDFLLSCVQQLPDRYRLVFNLYALDSFYHIEIAEMLKISEGTSKSNLSRARVLLKQRVEIHQQKKEKA